MMPENKTDENAYDPTIVGGRPLSREQLLKGIPRGIEVLIKKASVDPDFRAILLEKRAEAAAEIDLELSSAEAGMLNAIPANQILKIIENTTVPDEHRRVFLGKVAGAMLALMGLGLPACSSETNEPKLRQIKVNLVKQIYSGGSRPDDPRVKYMTVIPPGRRRLQVHPIEKGSYTVDVVVDYECPFDKGRITVLFQKDATFQTARIEYQPEVVQVWKGKGKAIFHATGAPEETRWLYALLINANKKHAWEWGWHASSVGYEPGEYHLEDYLILHLIEFRKTWSE